MRHWNIEIYDTREGKMGTVRQVPAETEVEACEKVARKKGYLWIGTTDPAVHAFSGGFAIIREYYEQWSRRTGEELEQQLQDDIRAVRDGRADELRGLVQLFEADGYEEEWSEPTTPEERDPWVGTDWLDPEREGV